MLISITLVISTYDFTYIINVLGISSDSVDLRGNFRLAKKFSR